MLLSFYCPVLVFGGPCNRLLLLTCRNYTIIEFKGRRCQEIQIFIHFGMKFWPQSSSRPEIFVHITHSTEPNYLPKNALYMMVPIKLFVSQALTCTYPNTFCGSSWGSRDDLGFSLALREFGYQNQIQEDGGARSDQRGWCLRHNDFKIPGTTENISQELLHVHCNVHQKWTPAINLFLVWWN